MGQSTEEQLTHDIEDTRSRLSRDVDELGDKVSPSRMAERRKDAMKDKVAGIRDKVMGTMDDAQGRMSGEASHLADATGGSAHQATSAVRHKTQGNPLAAGVVAFGAGMLLSALLPASDAETKAAQRGIETAKEHDLPEQAKQMASDMGQELRESGKQAASEVKDTATESGQELGGQGTDAAKEFADSVKESRH